MLFGLAQHHKYSIAELENMIAYEKDLIFDMVADYVASKKRAQES